MKTDKSDKTPHERIALGECMSTYGVDRCPYCIDTCDAAHFRMAIEIELKKSKITLNQNEPKD